MGHTANSLAILKNATSWPKKTWDGLNSVVGWKTKYKTQSWTPTRGSLLFIGENKYLIKAPPFKPIHTCNDRMQPHPLPTPGLQRRGVARVYTASRHCEEASGRPQPDLMTRRREELANRSVAASRRREEATSPPAASQGRSVAKTRRREERTPEASQRRKDTRGPRRGTASQRRDDAKIRKPSRSVAASQRLTASEPTWRTHCLLSLINGTIDGGTGLIQGLVALGCCPAAAACCWCCRKKLIRTVELCDWAKEEDGWKPHSKSSTDGIWWTLMGW